MDPRYPIGKFQRPSSWSDDDRKAGIAHITALPKSIRDAVAGLSDAQLDTPYRDGGWTVRQVVHHVADSHVNAYCRVRLALTEDSPTIKPYAEDKWAQLLDARTQPVAISLSMLDAVHGRWVTLLNSLGNDQFARRFNHPESGPSTIDGLVALYSWHGRHHTAHITELRKAKGW
ncbi:MAG TPA: putative metal-dependent hydrolase [Gemmatimonadaceae bacterium]|nr:putative metal-dependent hydrolase [Gemmatimonadaceae bacterium]